MRTNVLVVLLLGSNLVWWLAWPRAGEAAASPASESEPSPVGPTVEERLASSQRELQQAQARIAELESTAARAVAPKPAAKAVDGEARAAREAQAAAARRGDELQKQWVQAALQTSDPVARERALAAIREALQQADPGLQQAALRALARLAELDYDKATYRALVLPCLQSAHGDVRAAALYALWNTQPEPSDLQALLPMVADASPAVRRSLAHVVALYRKGQLDGEAADVVVRLLDDQDDTVRRNTLSGIWGAKVDARLEDRLFAMFARPETRHDAVYFGLSTLAAKSERVVSTLVGLLTDADPNVSDRARWGLQSGVPAASHALVADQFLALLETRPGVENQQENLQMVERYGSARHVPSLEAFAARPGLSAPLRQRIEAVVNTLRAR